MKKFTKLGLTKGLTDVLKQFGFKEPSEIQEKTNDPCGGLGWEDYKSPSPVGLGFYT